MKFLTGIAYFFAMSLFYDVASEKVDIQPAFLAVFGEGDAAGDSFVVAFHVEVMADVGVILFFIRIAFATRHKRFFVFPHHLEESIGGFCGGFAPASREVRARVLRPFPTSLEMTMSFVFGKVVPRLLVGAGLFFFGGKCQRSKVFGCTVFVDFIQASLTPVVAKETVRCGGRCQRLRRR